EAAPLPAPEADEHRDDAAVRGARRDHAAQLERAAALEVRAAPARLVEWGTGDRPAPGPARLGGGRAPLWRHLRRGAQPAPAAEGGLAGRPAGGRAVRAPDAALPGLPPLHRGR